MREKEENQNEEDTDENQTTTKGDFNFMGEQILNSVLDDLLQRYGMNNAKLVLFVGVR